jgi:hypothetical protein
MSKAYKGKTCVYCCTPRSSETADHVVATAFMPVNKREDLPKVPACVKCNGIKSRLEHYAATVLPFGGQHGDANAILTTMVQPRLEKNLPLARDLNAGLRHHLVTGDWGKTWHEAGTMPFDGERVARWYMMVMKGLAHWHWQIELPDAECGIHGSFFTQVGEELVQRFFMGRARAQRVNGNLGDGAFVYEGVQWAEDPRLTFWRMSLYGAVLADDKNAPHERPSAFYGATAPRGMRGAGMLAELMTVA